MCEVPAAYPTLLVHVLNSRLKPALAERCHHPCFSEGRPETKGDLN